MEPADIVSRDRLADAVCHDEQMEVWASELLDEFMEWLPPPSDYEDGLAMRAAAKRAVRAIVDGAFSHPELLGLPAQRLR